MKDRHSKARRIFSSAITVFVLICHSSYAQDEESEMSLFGRFSNIFSNEDFRLGSGAEVIDEILLSNGLSKQQPYEFHNYYLLTDYGRIQFLVSHFPSDTPRTRSREIRIPGDVSGFDITASLDPDISDPEEFSLIFESYFGMPPVCNDGTEDQVWPEYKNPSGCRWTVTPNFTGINVQLFRVGFSRDTQAEKDYFEFALTMSFQDVVNR